MTPAFKMGDKVRLNSGGPLMTVQKNPDVNGWVEVTWFGHGDHPLHAAFPEACLNLVSDDA